MSEFLKSDLKITPIESEPRAFQKSEFEKSKVETVSDLYPIYWVRLLKILMSRAGEEVAYSNERQPEGLSEDIGHSYPRSDLKYRGIRITELKQELSSMVNNQNLKSENVKPLITEMMLSDAPYINSEQDEKNNQRFFVTLLGSQAYSEISRNGVMSGFWKLVERTQIPSREPKSTRKRRHRP